MAASPDQEQQQAGPITYDHDEKVSRHPSSTSISSDGTQYCNQTNFDKEGEHHTGGDLLAERPSQGSNLAAFFNIVCVVAGTGTLGLPYSLAKGNVITYAHPHTSGSHGNYQRLSWIPSY